ncbi:MAG: hypothetical protein ACE37I_05310 [Rubinisphaera brasiliensis]|uniref:hypothetical protein n=1 Tax=Rubinisphaera brasiliensis TaxID=119 RepID=UPI00391ADA42
MTRLLFFDDKAYEAGTSWSDYARYWRDNRDALNDVLLRLNGGMLPIDILDDVPDPIVLHDSRVQTFDATRSTITMSLHGDNKGALREIHLRYTGVTEYDHPSKQLFADQPESDLLIHETTANADGLFKHTMRFANDELIAITFTKIEVKTVDHPLPA